MNQNPNIQKLKDHIKQDFPFNKFGEGDELVITDITIKEITPEVAAILAPFSLINSIELSQCSLQSLQGLPNFPQLQKLCLEENLLDDSALEYISKNFTKLQFLSLTGNKIANIESLDHLKALKELVQLDLQDNPVSQHPQYREKTFQNCVKLEILDNTDKDGEEIQYSDDDDQFEETPEDGDFGEENDEKTDDDDEYDEEEVESEEEDEEEDGEPVNRKKRR